MWTESTPTTRKLTDPFIEIGGTFLTYFPRDDTKKALVAATIFVAFGLLVT